MRHDFLWLYKLFLIYTGFLLGFLLGFPVPSFSQSNDMRQIREPLLGLSSAQTILLKATNKQTSGHMADSTFIQKIFSTRMEELGYTVLTDSLKKHDVVVELNCENQTPKDNRTLRSVGKNQMNPFTQEGPPCKLRYFYEGRPIPWQRINRIVYAEGVKVAKALPINHPAYSTTSQTIDYLEQYDFPLLLSAEWGHIDRLIRIFHSPETTHIRQRFIISLLGEIHATPAFSFLVKTLQKEHLITTTARALGHFGEQARPYLMDLLKTSSKPEVLAAAAYSLGNVGALTGDTRSTPLLLKILTTPGVDIDVRTEIVWALGKAPDFSAFQTLEDLERDVWQTTKNDPGLQKLRQAVDWSIREVRQGGHTDDY